jgi:hypothetical protein
MAIEKIHTKKDIIFIYWYRRHRYDMDILKKKLKIYGEIPFIVVCFFKKNYFILTKTMTNLLLKFFAILNLYNERKLITWFHTDLILDILFKSLVSLNFYPT